MHIMNKQCALLGGVCLAVVATAPVFAQETQDIPFEEEGEEEINSVYTAAYRIPENQITVLASGERLRLDDNGRAITVISAEEIIDLQTPDIAQILERAPGVTTTRNGQLGGFTALRVRGSTSDQVLVLVDGVRLNDPSAPGAGFDFGNILTQNIRKIEVLRGANSVIWGSNAIGGVIAIETGADDRSLTSFSAEGGSFGTVSLSGGVSPTLTEWVNLSLSGGYFDNSGFSSFDGGAEDDGFRQGFVNGRLDAALTDEISLFVQGRYAGSDLDIDGFPAPAFAFADTDEFMETQQFSASAGAEYVSSQFQLKALYSIADIDRDNFNPAFGDGVSFFAEGRNERVEVRGKWDATDTLALHFGVENEETSFTTGPFGTADGSGIASVYSLVRYGTFNGINISAGLRYDNHEQFGDELSFGADAVVPLGDTGLSLVAAYQEGFRAPSLFQLLSDFGNTLLQPETSEGYEAGLRYNNSDNFSVNIVFFQRDTDNLIDFISCFGVTSAICVDRPFGTFDNVLEVRARGVELDAMLKPTDRLTIRAAYSHIDTENQSSGSANFGNDLARQPDNVLTLSGDWAPITGLLLGSDIRLVSDSFDDAGNFVLLDGFALFRLRAAYQISENFELFGRIENLFDKDYQTVAGFGTPGMSAFGGLRIKL